MRSKLILTLINCTIILLLGSGCQSTKQPTSEFAEQADSLGIIYAEGVGQLISVRHSKGTSLVTAAHVLGEPADSTDIDASFSGKSRKVKLVKMDLAGDFAELSSEETPVSLTLPKDAKVSENLFLVARSAKGKLFVKKLKLILSGINLPLQKGPKRIRDLYLEDICFASGVANPGDSGGAVFNNKKQLLGYLVGQNPQSEFVFFRRLRAANWPLKKAPESMTIEAKAKWLTEGFVKASKNSQLSIDQRDFEELWAELTKKCPEDQRIRRFWRIGLQALLDQKRAK